MRYPKRNSQSSEVEFDASEGEFSKHHCEGLQSSLSLALVLELGSSGCFDDNPSSWDMAQEPANFVWRLVSLHIYLQLHTSRYKLQV